MLFPSVQRGVAKYLAAVATERLGAEVRIGNVAISLFGKVLLEDVFVGDLRGDTLFSVGHLRVEALRVHPRAQLIRVGALELDGGRFALAKAKGDAYSNLTNLLNKLASEDSAGGDAEWRIQVQAFAIHGLHFSFHNAEQETQPFGIDFDHVDVRDVHLVGNRFHVAGDSISAHLGQFSLRERSGFHVQQLAGTTVVSGRGITIDDMVLRTPNSEVHGALRLITGSWADYNAFNEQVQMRLELDSSRLDFADIAYFAPELEGIHLPIGLEGLVRGTVSELKGRGMQVHFGENSYFKGSAELNGLPDLANTFILLDIDELRTGHQDLGRVPIPPFTSGERLVLPPELRELGNLRFAGNFTGFTSSFTAYGRARTDLGDLRTDLSFKRDIQSGIFTIAGRIATESLVLGPLLNSPSIGAVAANIRIEGSGRRLATMKADLEGSIPLFTLNNTRLTGITANGRVEPDIFNGSLSADNEYLVMDFSGLADLRGDWPVVDFTANVQHMDLAAFGLTPVAGYNTLSVLVSAEGRLSPDSLQGRVDVQGISYCDERGDHELGDLLLTSGRSAGENVLTLTSSFADAEVIGNFLPTKLPGAITSIVYSVFPALSQEVIYAQADQDFRFTVTTKETGPVLELFVPGLELAPGGVVNGSLNSRRFNIGLGAKLPNVRFGKFVANDVEIALDKALDILAFSVSSTRQTWGDSVWFDGASLTGKAYQDDLEFALGWDASSGGTKGELDLLGEVRGLGSYTFDLLPSNLFFGRGDWSNKHTARFLVDSSTVRIDSLVLLNEGQRIALDGTITKDATRPLSFQLGGVDLENLTPFLNGPVVKGRVDATGDLYDLYNAPFVLSAVQLDSVMVQDKPVGDIRLNAQWADGERAIALDGDLMRGAIKALDFRGGLSLESGNALDLSLVMDRFDLRFIDPYLPEGISEIQGQVTGVLDVTGTLLEPQVNGELDMVDAGLRIDYLNTLYRFSHKVQVRPDMFALDLVTIRDEEGNTARLIGTILHKGLKDWNYNVSGTLDRFMVMNTTIKENSLYYGKAYGTGDVEVSGYAGRMDVVVDARTAPGTDIHFPVGGSTEVSPIGFVRFTAGDTANGEGAVVDLSGITLDMKVEVTPDALFELIFDPTVGDILSGRGRGNMEMTVGQSGEFSMRGQVEVSDGEYLFTLRNVINKRFQIQPGGRIVWFGDPFDANLDLAAIYRVRAPLYDIMFEKNDAYRRRVPVDVVMNLRDKLLNPEIQFNVRLPSVDEGIRMQVNSVLSTEQEMNRQVFALIVLNRFVQPPAYNTGQGSPGSGGALAGTTTSELLSNQVSNWLSRLSNEFDLGVNYRPGDNITQDELELAVSTQLFDERLLVSTNLGVQYGAQSASTSNTIVGDFQIEYLIGNDGKLRMKAFSVSNDRNLNRADQALTTQGAGVAYREEFDTSEELWQKVLNIFRAPAKDRKFD
ncbi:MAG: translocation/assembly module TamB domain-containing protein [Flavobacteriales bacterium]